jgi:hypothetical protein
MIMRIFGFSDVARTDVLLPHNMTIAVMAIIITLAGLFMYLLLSAGFRVQLTNDYIDLYIITIVRL